MADTLRQIVYASIPCGVDSDTQVADILRVSRARNTRDQVTGLLYADARHFMQAIEGPADAIAATYERIRADDRHRDIELLEDRELVAREFGA